VLIKVGASDAGAAQCKSHTGALAGRRKSIARVRQLGVNPRYSIEELIDVLKVSAAFGSAARTSSSAPRRDSESLRRSRRADWRHLA